jgi:hypothetical protein
MHHSLEDPVTGDPIVADQEHVVVGGCANPRVTGQQAGPREELQRAREDGDNDGGQGDRLVGAGRRDGGGWGRVEVGTGAGRQMVTTVGRMVMIHLQSTPYLCETPPIFHTHTHTHTYTPSPGFK